MNGVAPRPPRARVCRERGALIREGNEAIADQVRGYYARRWAEGNADAVVCEFLCECGDPACDASVLLPVGALAAGAVLASSHA